MPVTIGPVAGYSAVNTVTNGTYGNERSGRRVGGLAVRLSTVRGHHHRARAGSQAAHRRVGVQPAHDPVPRHRPLVRLALGRLVRQHALDLPLLPVDVLPLAPAPGAPARQPALEGRLTEGTRARRTPDRGRRHADHPQVEHAPPHPRHDPVGRPRWAALLRDRTLQGRARRPGARSVRGARQG